MAPSTTSLILVVWYNLIVLLHAGGSIPTEQVQYDTMGTSPPLSPPPAHPGSMSTVPLTPSLTSHLKLPPPMEDGSYPCTLCCTPKTFQKRSWYRHMASHDPTKQLICPFCKTYSHTRGDKMKNHVNKCALTVSGKPNRGFTWSVQIYNLKYIYVFDNNNRTKKFNFTLFYTSIFLNGNYFFLYF